MKRAVVVHVVSLTMAAAFLGLGAGQAVAQYPTSGQAPTGEVPAAQAEAQAVPQNPTMVEAATTPDAFLRLVPVRSIDSIRGDIERATSDAQAARAQQNGAEGFKVRVESQLKLQDQEIKGLKDRIKVAKNNKNETEVIALEAEKKSAERAKTLLERRREMRKIEAEAAKAAMASANAWKAALSLELELATKREQARMAAGGPDMGTARTQLVLRELEGRTLKAQKEHASKAEDLAKRQKQLVERRLDLFEAQRKLQAGEF